MTTYSPEYRDYMRSPAWRARRERALQLAGYRCQICGEPATQVHHNNYARLGHERDSDLTATCWQCHKIVTWWLRARRFFRSLRGNKRQRRARSWR